MGLLSIYSLALGLVLLVTYGLMWAKPDAAITSLRAFPRSTKAAWVLTSIDLVWSGILLHHTPLGPVESYKFLLFALVPLAIVLLVRFVDELLAVRALGGLLILIPAPLLDAARWNASPWRLFVVVLCYLMVIKGVVLILAPYTVRKGLDWGVKKPGRIRPMLGLGMAMGLALVVLALTVYRVA